MSILALTRAGKVITTNSRPIAADGNGQIIVTFDKQTQTLTLKSEHRKIGATFDRFGLFNLQTGGHFVDVSLDDLTYTVKGK